jgi:integrase
VPLEAVFETAYTFGWRHGEITPLKVRQFRNVSPTEAWLHLDADTTKNMEARVVPLGPWCVRLIEMLRKLVKDKQPNDLIFTRGLNHRAVQRFDKLWKRGCRLAGVNESLLVHDLRRTAAQRMLDAGIAVPRMMQICGWKTMSTFLRYAMTGRNVLRPKLEKLVEFERKQRQGRQELVQQMEMERWRTVGKCGHRLGKIGYI